MVDRRFEPPQYVLAEDSSWMEGFCAHDEWKGGKAKETDDGSLFSSCVIVRLQSTMSSLLFQERC